MKSGIVVKYDDKCNVISVTGCNHDFSYIRNFCEKTVGSDELLDVILMETNPDGSPINCDCDYLINYDGDFIITEEGELPLNPN